MYIVPVVDDDLVVEPMCESERTATCVSPVLRPRTGPLGGRVIDRDSVDPTLLHKTGKSDPTWNCTPRLRAPPVTPPQRTPALQQPVKWWGREPGRTSRAGRGPGQAATGTRTKKTRKLLRLKGHREIFTEAGSGSDFAQGIVFVGGGEV